MTWHAIIILYPTFFLCTGKTCKFKCFTREAESTRVLGIAFFISHTELDIGRIWVYIVHDVRGQIESLLGQRCFGKSFLRNLIKFNLLQFH
jgi:hypothetical protein